MSGRHRRTALFFAAVALSTASFIGGRLADVSTRDPRALAAVVGMLATFGAVLWLGDRRPDA